MISAKPWTLDRIFNFLLLIFITAFVLFAASWLSDALVPFGIALLAAYALDPVVSRVQGRVKNRSVAVGVVLGSLLLIASAFAWFLIPPVLQEFARMAELLAKLATDSDLARRLAEKLPPDLWERLREQLRTDRLLELVRNQQYLDTIKNALASLMPGVAGVLSGTFKVIVALFGLFLIAVYLVFMLLDFQGLRDDIKAVIPDEMRPTLFTIMQEFDQQMSRYFRAQAVVALVLSLVFAGGFWAIGMPLGIVLGLVAGASTMVPYLQLVTVPPALILGLLHALDVGSSVPVMLGLVLAVYMLVQVLQDWVIGPRILGNAMGLSPVMILLSISVWGQLLGMLGLVMAIPFTCLVLAWWKRLLASRKQAAQVA